MTKGNFIKQIESFFKANKLEIDKPKQFLSRTKLDEILKLKKMAAMYQGLYPQHGRQSCSCQKRINNFIIVLQVFVKNNKVVKPEVKEVKK